MFYLLKKEKLTQKKGKNLTDVFLNMQHAKFVYEHCETSAKNSVGILCWQ